MRDLLHTAAAASRPIELSLPTLADARAARARRARARRGRRITVAAAGGTAALAAGALVVLGLPAEPLRERGLATPPDLHVQAAVVEPSGRTLDLARSAGPTLDDQLVFRIEAGASGTLRITEQRAGGAVQVLVSEVQAGVYVPGGTTPLGWTPERGPGRYDYLVELCESDGLCARRSLEVTWR